MVPRWNHSPRHGGRTSALPVGPAGRWPEQSDPDALAISPEQIAPKGPACVLILLSVALSSDRVRVGVDPTQ